MAMAERSMSWEATGAAALALAIGIALALVLDLAAPRGGDARAPQTAPSAAEGDTLAAKMEAQTNAGAPGVAIALEQNAKPEERANAGVSAAHAHAQVLLGDAPGAFATVKQALAGCDSSNACAPPERASLERLERVLGALVSAGIVDPAADPQRVDQILQGMFPGASFQH